MLEFDVRFVHVISDELLKAVPRAGESTGSWKARREALKRRRIVDQLVKKGAFEAPSLWAPDSNWYRRFTYAFVFPNAEEGDFNTVAWSFARQGDGDTFARSVGRGISETRLFSFLDSQRRHKFRVNRGNGNGQVDSDVYFANESTLDRVEQGEFGLPEKVVGAMLACQRQLSKAADPSAASVIRTVNI
jgi:hypothetical protein